MRVFAVVDGIHPWFSVPFNMLYPVRKTAGSSCGSSHCAQAPRHHWSARAEPQRAHIHVRVACHISVSAQELSTLADVPKVSMLTSLDHLRRCTCSCVPARICASASARLELGNMLSTNMRIRYISLSKGASCTWPCSKLFALPRLHHACSGSACLRSFPLSSNLQPHQRNNM